MVPEHPAIPEETQHLPKLTCTHPHQHPVGCIHGQGHRALGHRWRCELKIRSGSSSLPKGPGAAGPPSGSKQSVQNVPKQPGRPTLAETTGLSDPFHSPAFLRGCSLLHVQLVQHIKTSKKWNNFTEIICSLSGRIGCIKERGGKTDSLQGERTAAPLHCTSLLQTRPFSPAQGIFQNKGQLSLLDG